VEVTIAGDPGVAAHIQRVYSATGTRAFDFDFMGSRVYGADGDRRCDL